MVGISIGIHGVVHHNHISFTPYYDYAGLDLAAAVSSRFSIPVILENEANLSIIGEKAFCYNYPNMAGISVHSGIGMGLIVDGKLYTGCSGCAENSGIPSWKRMGGHAPAAITDALNSMPLNVPCFRNTSAEKVFPI